MKIRKQIGSEWKIFGETNTSTDASNISVDIGTQKTTVQNALNQQHTDIEVLKQNVSWLALHGGGGAGGGGGGGSSGKAKCTIKVNAATSGAELAIIEGQTNALTIELTNTYPANPVVKWEVTMVAGTFSYAFSVDKPTYSKVIEYDKIKDQLKADSKTLLRITASYSDTTNGVYGSASWSGYIYLAQIQLKFPDWAGSVKLTDIATTPFRIQISTPLDDQIACTTTVVGSNKMYVYDDINKEGDIYLRDFSKTILELFKGKETAQSVVATVYSLTVTATSTTNPTITKSTTISLPITSDTISLGVTGISQIEAQPTEISEDAKSFSLSWIAYLSNAQSYYITLSMLDDDGQLITLFDSKAAKIAYPYNVPFSRFISLPPSVESIGQVHEFYIKATDATNAGTTVTTKGYVKLVQSANAFLKYQDSTLEQQMIGIYSNNLGQFNALSSTMHITCDTQFAKEGWSKPVVTLSSYYINNNCGIKTDTDVGESYLAVKNGMYILTDTKYANKTVWKSRAWTIAATFKSDHTADDNEILMAIGYVNRSHQKSFVEDGICVKPRGVYRIRPNSQSGSTEPVYTKLCELVDDKYNILHFVYNNNSSAAEGNYTQWDGNSIASTELTAYGGHQYYLSNFKIYLDGVLVHESNTCPFNTSDPYGGFATITHIDDVVLVLGGQNATNYGNMQFYSIEAFNKCFDMNDLLVSYCNSKIRTNFTQDKTLDYSQKKLELDRCIFSEDATDHVISSLVYVNGSYNFNALVGDSLSATHPPLSYDELVNQNPQLYKIAKDIPFPIVYLDVSQNSDWTYENFIHKVTRESHILKDKTAKTLFYYWDPRVKDSFALSCPEVETSLQGTSTLGTYVKNVNIQFPKNTESQKETLFFATSSWIPENIYTLKSDVVDSSHSNNAAIGKFINSMLSVDLSTGSYNTDFGFIFNKDAMASVKQTKQVLNEYVDTTKFPNKDAFDSVTIKHTVEGYPVLMFMRFYAPGMAEEQNLFKMLGIYSFNLGRDAVRNMGFQSITEISCSSGKIQSFPTILHDSTVKTNNVVNSAWIERSESSTFTLHDLSNFNDNNTVMDKFGDDEGFLGSASFWQNNTAIIDNFFKVRYSSTGDKPPAHTIDKFKKLVDEIVPMPIEGRCIHNTGSICQQSDSSGTFYLYRYDGGTLVKDTTQLMKTAIAQASEVEDVERQFIMRYMIVALMFGLVDNFDKNVSYRSWNGSNFITEFYDLDTALGLTNEGLENVSPALWFNFLHNIVLPNGINVIDESYKTANIPSSLSSEFAAGMYVPESTGNKLFLCLDSNVYRTYAGDQYSQLSYIWFKLRNVLQAKVVEAGYSSLVDFFIDKYFKTQTSNCGTLLFNYDYASKYVNYFDSVPHDYLHVNNLTTKLHGRRYEYVKHWLTDHFNFLDSYFEWRLGSHSEVLSHFEYYNAFAARAKEMQVTSNSTTSKNKIKTSAEGNSYSISNFSTTSQTSTRYYTYMPKRESVTYGLPGMNNLNYSMNSINNMLSVDLTQMYLYALGTSTKLYNLISFKLTNQELQTQLNLPMFFDDTNGLRSQLKTLDLAGLSSIPQVTLDFGTHSRWFQNLQSINISRSKNIQDLILGDAPLHSLVLSASAVQSLNMNNQPYLRLPDLTDCNQLTSLQVGNCKMDSSLEAFGYTDLQLFGFDNLNTVQIDGCNTLRSIHLSNCPNLTSLILQDCEALTSVTVNACIGLSSGIRLVDNENLVRLSFNGCTQLSSIDIKQSTLSNITDLDVGKTKIYGFNIYSSVLSDYSMTEHNGCKVLDLSGFSALTSLTYQYNNTIEMIRFRNDPANPFTLTQSPGSGGYGTPQLTNLKRIYGHVNLNGASFYGCAQFSLLSDDSWFNVPTDLNMTVFQNKGLQNTTISAMQFDSELSANGHYYLKHNNVSEYQKTDWPTNFDFESSTSPSFYADYALTKRDMYYVMYKLGIANVKKQLNIKSLNQIFYGDPNTPTIDKYLFKGLDTLENINGFMFWYNGTTYAHSTATYTDEIMSTLPNLTSFNSCTYQINLYANTFDHTNKITWFGTSQNWGTQLKFYQSYGSEARFFNGLSSLVTISRLNIDDFDFTKSHIPTSVKTIEHSFNSNIQAALDFGLMFQQNSELTGIYNSFNGTSLTVLLRPSSFNNLTKLKHVGYNYYTSLDSSFYNATNTKCFVTDKAIDPVALSVRSVEEYRAEQPSFGVADWENLQENLLKPLSALETFEYVFANSSFEPYNVIQSEFATFPGEFFVNNTYLQSIDYGMMNARYKYALTPRGFRNCHQLKNCNSLFLQNIIPSQLAQTGYDLLGTVSLSSGIVGEIPLQLFYHGVKDVTEKTISGLISADSRPVVYQTFKTDLGMASKTNDFVSFKTSLNETLVTSRPVFDRISSLYFEAGDLYFDFADTEVFNALSTGFQSVLSVDSEGNYHVRPDDASHPYSKIWNSLSAISVNISSTARQNDAYGLEHVTYEISNYYTSICNLKNCFYGNGSISCYSGSTVTEQNANYNPYKYVFTGSSWTTNTNVDAFVLDDSWSQNGRLSNDDGTLAYDPTHKNTVDSQMSAMGIFTTLTCTTWGPISPTTSGNVKAYFYNPTTSDGYPTNLPANVMNYICAPDLLRYCSNSTVQTSESTKTTITGLFAHTSNSTWEINPDGESEKASMFKGLNGRIPPNLFRHLTNILDVSEMFAHCRYITGYKRGIYVNGVLTNVEVFYIPEGLFLGMKNIKYLHNMFYDNVFPCTFFESAPSTRLTFSPISDIPPNIAAKLDVSGMFAKSVWLTDSTIEGTFSGPSIQTADGAFSFGAVSGKKIADYWYMTKFVAPDYTAGGTFINSSSNTQRIATLNKYQGEIQIGTETKPVFTVPILGINFSTEAGINGYAAYAQQDYQDALRSRSSYDRVDPRFKETIKPLYNP